MRSFLLVLLLAAGHFSECQKNNLDFYLKQAIHNSPLLKDFQSQMESNSIDSQRIRAQYHPQVTGSSMNYLAPTVNGWG
jgi:hypothetical protein